VSDYSNHPPTIGEIRSDKSESAADWSPRDALITALRAIDSGEWKPEYLLIAGIARDKDGYNNFEHYFAGGYILDLLALMERVKMARA
jgi:hypothetical protein